MRIPVLLRGALVALIALLSIGSQSAHADIGGITLVVWTRYARPYSMLPSSLTASTGHSCTSKLLAWTCEEFHCTFRTNCTKKPLVIERNVDQQ